MALARELGGAVALAFGRADLVAGRPPAERVQALAWLPMAGLVLGGTAALVASAVAPIAPAPAALAGALLLAAAQGPPRHWPLRVGATLASATALLSLGPAARTLALVVAPMLARWAVVVQCYGGRARPDAEGLAALAGRARFREFAIASVTALGTTLVLLDAVGLAIAVACALATLAIRVLAYRRSGGGLGNGALDATVALVETLAIVMLSSIGSVLGPR